MIIRGVGLLPPVPLLAPPQPGSVMMDANPMSKSVVLARKRFISTPEERIRCAAGTPPCDRGRNDQGSLAQRLWPTGQHSFPRISIMDSDPATTYARPPRSASVSRVFRVRGLQRQRKPPLLPLVELTSADGQSVLFCAQ